MNTLFTTLKNNAIRSTAIRSTAIKTTAVALLAGAALLATPQKANAQAVLGFRAGHARIGVGIGVVPAYPYATPVYAPPVYGYGYAAPAPAYGYYGAAPYYRRDWDHDRGYDRHRDFDRRGWR